MKRITIIETDCHGCGIITDGETTNSYAYDDGGLGDIGGTMRVLKHQGIVSDDEVDIYDEVKAIKMLHELKNKPTNMELWAVIHYNDCCSIFSSYEQAVDEVNRILTLLEKLEPAKKGVIEFDKEDLYGNEICYAVPRILNESTI